MADGLSYDPLAISNSSFTYLWFMMDESCSASVDKAKVFSIITEDEANIIYCHISLYVVHYKGNKTTCGWVLGRERDER